MPHPEPRMPLDVVDAIQNAFPRDFEAIMKDIRWFSLEGCWGFTRWGMFVGVEPDGYIHS